MDTSDPHLDAETLAAWVDGGLSGAELRMVESHVADCARCQSLVGAMARTSAAVPPLEPQRPSRRWLAWVVPLTAAATAVVIWTTVPRTTSTPATATNLPAQPARAAQPAAAPEQQPEIVVSPEVIPEREEPTLEKKAAALPPAASPPAAPAAPAESRDRFTQNNEATTPPLQARKDAAAASVAAPAARTLSANIALPAPNMQALCGATWSGAAPAVTTPLTAGTSPSADVCWIVGRLGVVLLTTDGRTWKGLTFPAITDLSSITATDARNATVMTADGRAFMTVDGGMTWMPR